jgi:hypothetical protein
MTKMVQTSALQILWYEAKPLTHPAEALTQAGSKTADVCRKHGVSEATFYK